MLCGSVSSEGSEHAISFFLGASLDRVLLVVPGSQPALSWNGIVSCSGPGSMTRQTFPFAAFWNQSFDKRYNNSTLAAWSLRLLWTTDLLWQFVAVNFHVSVVLTLTLSFAMVTSESINSCGSINQPIYYHFCPFLEIQRKQHTATDSNWQQLLNAVVRRCFVMLCRDVASRVFWCAYAAPLASSAPRTVLSWFRNSV